MVDSQLLVNASVELLFPSQVEGQKNFTYIIELQSEDHQSLYRTANIVQYQIKTQTEEGEEQVEFRYFDEQDLDDMALNIERAKILNEPDESTEEMMKELENLPETLQEEIKNLEKLDLKLEELPRYSNPKRDQTESIIEIYKESFVRKALLYRHQADSHFLSVPILGLSRQDILKFILKELHFQVQRYAEDIEDGSDFPSLIFAGKNEGEYDIS